MKLLLFEARFCRGQARPSKARQAGTTVCWKGEKEKKSVLKEGRDIRRNTKKVKWKACLHNKPGFSGTTTRKIEEIIALKDLFITELVLPIYNKSIF